eukprot:5934260-Pleurochrysis_carterae.AAC.3
MEFDHLHDKIASAPSAVTGYMGRRCVGPRLAASAATFGKAASRASVRAAGLRQLLSPFRKLASERLQPLRTAVCVTLSCSGRDQFGAVANKP